MKCGPGRPECSGDPSECPENEGYGCGPDWQDAGQAVVDAIIEGGMVRLSGSEDVFVWNGNAAEQIGEALRRWFDAAREGKVDTMVVDEATDAHAPKNGDKAIFHDPRRARPMEPADLLMMPNAPLFRWRGLVWVSSTDGKLREFGRRWHERAPRTPKEFEMVLMAQQAAKEGKADD